MDQTAPELERILTTISDVLRLLVDEPDDMKFEVVPNGGSNLMVRVLTSRQNTGRLIGTNGRMPRSMRTVMLGMGARLEIRIGLDIVENRGE